MRRRHRRATVEGENAMKGFIFGILTVILILALGLAFVLMGFVSMRADNPPSKMETALAGRAMDASVARAAPKLTNPVTADETNLVAGARLYRDHCALCHGDPAHPKSPLATRSIPLRRSSPMTWPTCRRTRFLHPAARHSLDGHARMEKRLKRPADLAASDFSQPHARSSTRRQASFHGSSAANHAVLQPPLNQQPARVVRLAPAIKLATIALPLENSPPQRLTNALNTLDASHRFRRT